MTDIVDRAKRLLRQGQPGGGPLVPASPAQAVSERQRSTQLVETRSARRADVIAEAQALLDRPARQAGHHPASPQAALPPARPATATAIRVAMTCGKFGWPFIAVAEIHGKNLVLTRNELAQPGAAPAQAAATASDLGSYRIAATPEWCCPHCRTRVNSHPLIKGELLWQCLCQGETGPLHCIGSDAAGGTYCACGQYEVRAFVAATAFAVRGERAAKAATNRPETPRAATLPQGSSASSPNTPPRSPAGSPVPRLTSKR